MVRAPVPVGFVRPSRRPVPVGFVRRSCRPVRVGFVRPRCRPVPVGFVRPSCRPVPRLASFGRAIDLCVGFVWPASTCGWVRSAELVAAFSAGQRKCTAQARSRPRARLRAKSRDRWATDGWVRSAKTPVVPVGIVSPKQGRTRWLVRPSRRPVLVGFVRPGCRPARDGFVWPLASVAVALRSAEPSTSRRIVRPGRRLPWGFVGQDATRPAVRRIRDMHRLMRGALQSSDLLSWVRFADFAKQFAADDARTCQLCVWLCSGQNAGSALPGAAAAFPGRSAARGVA